jgi:WD40 repeat protein
LAIAGVAAAFVAILLFANHFIVFSSSELTRSLQAGVDGVECLAVSPDGRTLAWGGYNTTIKLGDPESAQLRTLTGGKITVLFVAFSRPLRDGDARL